jgi:hypothetical protein
MRERRVLCARLRFENRENVSVSVQLQNFEVVSRGSADSNVSRVGIFRQLFPEKNET